MTRQPPFYAIGDILGKLFSKTKWNLKQKQYSLWEQWDTIVGTQIAGQATPLRWFQNMLVVGVKDSCWLQELRMMEEEILEKIRAAHPDLNIKGIRWLLHEEADTS